MIILDFSQRHQPALLELNPIRTILKIRWTIFIWHCHSLWRFSMRFSWIICWLADNRIESTNVMSCGGNYRKRKSLLNKRWSHNATAFISRYSYNSIHSSRYWAPAVVWGEFPPVITLYAIAFLLNHDPFQSDMIIFCLLLWLYMIWFILFTDRSSWHNMLKWRVQLVLGPGI